MDEQRERGLARAGMGASVLAAFAASICCIGPIVAAVFGLSSLGFLVKYESLRPLFTGITGVFLAGAFYLAYRKRPEAPCATESICETHGPERVRRINRIALWIVAAVAVTILTFPTWSNWVLG